MSSIVSASGTGKNVEERVDGSTLPDVVEGGTSDDNDANSSALASPTLLENSATPNVSAAAITSESPPRNKDDSALSTDGIGRLPTHASAAGKDTNSPRKIGIEELVAELDADGSGQIDLRKLAAFAIMKAAVPRKAASAARASEDSALDARISSQTASSGTDEIQDDPELGDDSKSSPLFADESSAPDDATSPLSTPPGRPLSVHDPVGPLPPVALLESIGDPATDERKTRGVLEEIYDQCPPMQPPTSIENAFGNGNVARKMRKEVPEQIHDRVGSTQTADLFADTNIAKKIQSEATNGPQNSNRQVEPINVNGLSPPVPFNYAEFEGLGVQKPRAEPLANIRPPADISNRNISEDLGSPRQNTAGFGPAGPVVVNHSGNDDGAMDTTPIGEQDQYGSLPRIPEAFLVEDEEEGEVIIATHLDPPVPLWKRKRVVCFFVFLALAVAAVVAGAMSSVVGKAETITETEVIALPTVSPTTSFVPTIVQSGVPSASLVPSSSPTKCSSAIFTGKQILDVPLDTLVDPKIAIHRRKLVAVARDPILAYVYVIFYSLEDNGWQRNDKYFIEEDLQYDTVALSDDVALVGFSQAHGEAGAGAGSVHMYEQDIEGIWEQVQEPIVPEDGGKEYGGFGRSVDMDADLACVTASGFVVYVFRRVKDQRWVQIESLDFEYFVDECRVAGNTVAGIGWANLLQLYQFEESLKKFVPLQNIRTLSGRGFRAISFFDNILVCTAKGHDEETERSVFKEVLVYYRQDKNQHFSLLQHFKSDQLDDEIGHALVLDGDILVVGGRGKTHVFSLQNGYFEETLTLNQQYTSYQLSGRNLLATTNEEIYSFDMDVCTQAMPTQTPSLSTAPSSSAAPTSHPSSTGYAVSSGVYAEGPEFFAEPPFLEFGDVNEEPTSVPTRSSSPSQRGAPSLLPSLSASPTEHCYWIDIVIDMDKYPEETSLTLSRIGMFGSHNIVKTHRGAHDEKYHREALCLIEGSYQFVIRDWDGICCDDGRGSYNVTSHGNVIVQGGKFRREEITTFDLPFDSNLTPSQMP